jgi:hypothetical protein
MITKTTMDLKSIDLVGRLKSARLNCKLIREFLPQIASPIHYRSGHNLKMI